MGYREHDQILRRRDMSKPLIVSIPHNLGRDEALRRIQTGLVSARQRFAAHLVIREERWTGSHLDFQVAALRQEVTGAIDVGQSEVTVTVQLPWVLAVIAEKAKALLARQGTLMLEKK
jgi:hypothetical protein